MDKQAQELLDIARMLQAQATNKGVAFVNAELDLSKTFAERAWARCATGEFSEAKVLAIAATEAYQTAKKFFTELGIGAEQRAEVALKIGTMTPWIERLATIT